MDLLSKIRNVPDFPKKGVQFKDITTLIKDPEAFSYVCNKIAKAFEFMGVTKVVGMEARGFIFGSVIAHILGVGFIPIRKPGKLPAETISETYQLEYGEDTLEMHSDAIEKGDKVLVVDDLLATGGTALAAGNLVKRCGGIVEAMVFVIELTGSLKGREVLEKEGYYVTSEVQIPVEE